MPLDLTIQTVLTGSYSRTVGIGLASYDLSQHPLGRLTRPFIDGVASGLFADKLYLSPTEGVTLAPSTPANVDLSGIVSDVLAENLVLVKVKGVLLWSRPENTHDIIVGNGTNPFLGWFGAGTHTESVAPASLMLHVHAGAGWPVTAATADILKILNGGAVSDVIYDLAIWGTSA